MDAFSLLQKFVQLPADTVNRSKGFKYVLEL